MESAGAPVDYGHPQSDYGTHRVANLQDPPRELSGLAWGVFVSLGVLALLAVIRLVSALNLHSAVTGEGDISGAYHTYSTWVGISTLAVLVSAGVFIAWFFRAYKNLRRLGLQNMRYGDGWAIGSWFIPFFNWVRPKNIANDIWRGSERGVDAWWHWRQVEVPSLVHWWWGLFLAQGLLAYVGQETTQSGYHKLTSFGSFSSGLSEVKSGTVVDILAQLIVIAAVVLAITVVSRITERLDQLRSEALAGAPPAPSFPPPAQPRATSFTAPTTPVPPASSIPPPPTEQLIQCPECAEWIQPRANVCRYCGHRLHPTAR